MTFWLTLVISVLALVLLPWATIAWGRRLARRPVGATPLSRWAWRLFILVPLVPLGAYCMLGHFAMTWGWATTIWIFAASAVRGLVDRDA